MTSGPVVGGTDRDALVALYNATGGTGWTNRANWLSGEPIGDWYGVTTDAAGRVTSLNLRSNNLTGSLPTEIGNLTALRFLYLYGNSGVTGPVPAEMANLTGLSSVYSFGTGLCLPPGLGSWHDALTVKSPMSSCTGAPPPTAQGPSFGTATVADRNWRRGEAIGAVALPAATGGVGALTYRLTPTLPSGLRFAPSTRVLSGTPTVAFPRTVFTLRATDGEGNAATLTFGIAVTSGPVVGGTDRDALVALYNATGGTGWTNRANWLSGEPIGDWYGVTTDAAGRVTSLNLGTNNLTGSFPSGMGSLTALRFALPPPQQRSDGAGSGGDGQPDGPFERLQLRHRSVPAAGPRLLARWTYGQEPDVILHRHPPADRPGAEFRDGNGCRPELETGRGDRRGRVAGGDGRRGRPHLPADADLAVGVEVRPVDAGAFGDADGRLSEDGLYPEGDGRGRGTRRR